MKHHRLKPTKFIPSCLILCWGFFFSSFTLPGQSLRSQDSLRTIINRSTGKDKFEAILALMRASLQSEPTKSLSLSHDAVSVALEMGDSLLHTRALYAQGFIQTKLSSFDEAIQTLNRALKIAHKNSYQQEEGKILNSLAICYSLTGDHDRALEYHFQTLSIHESLNNKEEMAITYNNIGFIHFKLKDYKTALGYFLTSLKLKEEISSNFDLESLHINIGLCYNQLKDFVSGEKFIRKALAVCGNHCAPGIYMEADLALGIMYLTRKQYRESLQLLEAALSKAKQNKELRYQMETLIAMADVHIEKKEFQSAEIILRECEAVGRSTQLMDQKIELLRRFVTVYYRTDELEKAITYQQRLSSVLDSVRSNEKLKNLGTILAGEAQKERLKIIESDNGALQQLNEDYNALLAIASVQTIGLVSGLLLVGLLCFKSIQMARTKHGQRAQELEEVLTQLKQQHRGDVDSQTPPRKQN